MGGRIMRWAILVVVFLAVCTGSGIAVKALIRPQERDYRTYYNPPRYNPPTYNPPLSIPPGPLSFQPLRVPTAQEYVKGVQLIESLQQAHRAVLNGNDWQFFYLVSTKRMAEEWIRFGVYELRGDSPNNNSLNLDGDTIKSELRKRILADTKTFRASEVTVLGVSQVDNTGDTLVLTKHVASENGRTATWHTRWWFTTGPGGGSLYDYEEQPHRLRVNAILASDEIHMSYGSQTRSPSTIAITRSITDRTAAYMQTGVAPFELPVTNEVLRLVTPMEVMRRGLIMPAGSQSKIAIARKLANDARPWPDIAPLALMLATTKDAQAIQKFRDTYGEHPIADIEEAKSTAAAGQKEQAREILERSLQEHSGEPMLLTYLYEFLDESERATLGTQAARGNTPTAAIRTLVADHCQDRDSFEAILNAYRALLPNDTEGILAQAVLDADRQDFANARKMVEILMARTHSGLHSEWRERFLKLYVTKLGRSKAEILDHKLLGPLFRD